MTDLASFLIAAQRAGQAHAYDGPPPATEAEAYAVQAHVSAAFGAVGGFKVAHAAGATRFAPIRADRCHTSDTVIPDRPALIAEVEIGWRIVAALPAADAADFAQRLAAAVRPVAAIELCAARLAGPLAKMPLLQLADGLSGHGLVTGTPLADWDGSDFTEVTLAAAIDGQPVFDGPARVPGGSAFASLAALVATLGDHCGGLHPGQTVITGSLLPPVALPAGARLAATINGLGTIAIG